MGHQCVGDYGAERGEALISPYKVLGCKKI